MMRPGLLLSACTFCYGDFMRYELWIIDVLLKLNILGDLINILALFARSLLYKFIR